MRNTRPRRLQAYRTSSGREPFTEWLISIHDRNTRNRIERRLDRIRYGNLGDYGSVGSGVFEVRLHFGPGYRVYFGEVDDTIVRHNHERISNMGRNSNGTVYFRYLDVALEEYQEDGDTPFFLMGLQSVVEAQGGVSAVAKKIGVVPQVLSDMLSSEKPTRIDLLSAVLTALGCRLSIRPLETEDKRVKHSGVETTTASLKRARPTLEDTTERGDLR